MTGRGGVNDVEVLTVVCDESQRIFPVEMEGVAFLYAVVDAVHVESGPVVAHCCATGSAE
jgi:hypothetical protein